MKQHESGMGKGKGMGKESAGKHDKNILPDPFREADLVFLFNKYKKLQSRVKNKF
jgi:hypothetical protein